MLHAGTTPNRAGVLTGRRMAGLLALLVWATPIAARAQRIVNPAITSKPGPNEGKRPAGWLVRRDSAAGGATGDSVLFLHRGKGYYLQSGPASIVWSPKNVARGTFVLECTLFSGKSGSTFPQPFGVFLGGRNMGTPRAEYTEFLVRNDGFYAVLHHVGPKVVTLKDWTTITGINPHGGGRDESVRNTFRVVVDDNLVQLVVNRSLAASFLRSTFLPDGEYGVHIGAKQSIQVESLGLEKSKK
ncbi:MAG: hypothetical protein H7Z40_08195 [Phycisphaerae bacterium]|nr:hypothetical protein [Gemmatimonadaceae bacterium]